MIDDAMRRLLDYHRRRYWLSNGWCLRFWIKESPITAGRPQGIKYSFTLHDVDMTRLLGFDNAHAISRRQTFDHRHRHRRLAELASYEFRDADGLIGDFFDAVEQACRQEGVAFEFDAEEIELEDETEDDEDLGE